MSKIIVVGDIHGCLRPFERLLEKLPLNWKTDTLVLLGDYIDRGPDSRGVLDLVMELKRKHGSRVIPLLGNHEWMFLRYLSGKDEHFFLANGGDSTLSQFMEEGFFYVPTEYIRFMSGLPHYWETEHYIFVHAGLRPKKPLEKQDLRDLLFIRNDFIKSKYNWGKRVIFGHTPFSEPLIEPNKIGIDTGCVYGGKLTALVLPDLEFISESCGR